MSEAGGGAAPVAELRHRSWIGWIAAGYAAFAAVWFCFSDRVIDLIRPRTHGPEAWRLYGGLLFVLVTSLLLLCLMRWAFRAIAGNYAALARHEAEIGRLQRLYAALSQINQAIVWTKTREELLAKICRALVEQGGFGMAWVGWEQPETHRLEPVAAAGDPHGKLAGIQIYTDDRPEAHGPAGTAFRTGRSCLCNDLLNDSMTLPWREGIRQRGFRAAAYLPIQEAGRTRGVLCVYAMAAHYFQDREIALLEEAAADISFALDNLVREQERLAAEAVARQEKLFSDTMIASMPGVLYFYDTDGRFLRWNRNFETVTGFSGEELQRMHPLDFFAPQDRPLLQARIGEVFEKGEASVEAPFLAKTGGTTPYYFTGRRVQFGGRTCLVGVGIDITDRKRAEAKLREQATLLDQAQDAIIVRDLAHRVLYWNKGATRLYGWTAAEADGRSVQELLFPDTAQLAQAMERVLAQGEWSGELRQATKAGNEVTVEGRWTLLRNERGEPTSVLAVNTDITGRKKIEAQFLRAQRLESIGTLAGGIAHDLNNLLAPIVMGVELLRAKPGQEGTERVIETIERSALRGTGLVKQVLSFARGMEGARVAVNLGQNLREIETIVRTTFPKDIALAVDCPKDLRPVSGDPTQLSQVLLNLCVNARDAMPAGGGIALRAGNADIDEQYAAMHPGLAAGRYVRLEVVDTGTGMPPEVVDRIFEPFFTTKEVGKGTGLGLSTVLGIVRGHGGLVTVDSEVGKGTAFRVLLPAQAEPAAPQAAAASSLARGRGELILVVDDEAAILDVTRQTLEAQGYAVITASDGAEAMGLFAPRQQEVALVLTDIMMPIMDGMTLIAALRRIRPDVRIIAMSGVQTAKTGARAASAGVHHFLPKPCTATDLLAAIGKVIAG